MNTYRYVINNPVNYVDPSGNFVAPQFSSPAAAVESGFLFVVGESIAGQAAGNIIRTGEVSTQAAFSRISFGAAIVSGIVGPVASGLGLGTRTLAPALLRSQADDGAVAGAAAWLGTAGPVNVFGTDTVDLGRVMGCGVRP